MKLSFLCYSSSFLCVTEDAVFAEPGPGGGTMTAGAVYTLPAQRNVPLPVAMQRLIPMATQGGKPRSFTLPRDSNLHTILTPPAKEEQQTHNGKFGREHASGVEHFRTYENGEEHKDNTFCAVLCAGGWADVR